MNGTLTLAGVVEVESLEPPRWPKLDSAIWFGMGAAFMGAWCVLIDTFAR